MKRMLAAALAALGCGCAAFGATADGSAFDGTPFVTEPGTMKPYWHKGDHIQGIACAPDAVYLGYQHGIFKYAWNGKFLKRIATPHHTGDICWYDGRIYTSVDVLEGPRPLRSGVVQVYDADLNLLASKDIPQGVDGITAKDGILYLGMNNVPEGHRVNQIGRMDAKTLEFLDRIDIDYGTDTRWGTQDITTDGENFWVAFYSEVPLAVFDRNWKPIRTLGFKANKGFDFLPKSMQGERPRFARGMNSKTGDISYRIDFFEFDGEKMVPMKPSARAKDFGPSQIEGRPFVVTSLDGKNCVAYYTKEKDSTAKSCLGLTRPGKTVARGFFDSGSSNMLMRCNGPVENLAAVRITMPGSSQRGRFDATLVGWVGDEKVVLYPGHVETERFCGETIKGICEGCVTYDFAFAPGTAPRHLDAIGIEDRTQEHKGWYGPRYYKIEVR